jgi:hypothetical protein
MFLITFHILIMILPFKANYKEIYIHKQGNIVNFFLRYSVT